MSLKTFIADDDALSLSMLRHTLLSWGYQVSTAADGLDAWNRLSRIDEPTLVILDWMMPGLTGLELCARLRGVPRVHPMYIILLTARGDTEDVVQGLDAGADDYIQKPYHAAELRARVDLAARTIALQSRLIAIAYEDALTGLYNRLRLNQIGADEVARSRRYQRPLTVLLMDVDHFKGINDQWGHAAGDQVLIQLSARLKSLIRHNDAACRIGGDELLILAPETDLATGVAIAERVLTTTRELPPMVDGQALPMTLSVGVAELAAGDGGLDDLIARADRALYEAKDAGRDCVRSATNEEERLAAAS
jgi:two-component system, cell cycle response regulator